MLARGVLVMAFALQAGTAQADPSETEALRELVAEQLPMLRAAGFPTLAFETVPASIYVAPYRPDATSREKRARTAWYHAQLPAGFPTTGNVRVLYLPLCAFSFHQFPTAEEGEAPAELSAIVEQVLVSAAFEAEGVTSIDVSGITGRDTLYRDEPIAAIRQINGRLLERRRRGQTTQTFAVFEPFCGTIDEEPSGPPPPPPSPPPPPPPREPIAVQTADGTDVYIASRFQSDLCRIRTGSAYNLSCRGWRPVQGDWLHLSGSKYRYVIKRGADTVKTAEFDLDDNPTSLRLLP